MTRIRASLLCALLGMGIVCVSLMTGMATGMAGGAAEQPAMDGRAVARAYIAGMESGDLDKLTALFRTNGRSSILENASDEGSWEHYRDHHLKPEMKAATNFKFTIAKESEDRFGETSLVRQTGTFTVDVKGETRTYRVAVSYVILTEDGQRRIAHLHWSSKPA